MEQCKMRLISMTMPAVANSPQTDSGSMFVTRPSSLMAVSVVAWLLEIDCMSVCVAGSSPPITDSTVAESPQTDRRLSICCRNFPTDDGARSRKLATDRLWLNICCCSFHANVRVCLCQVTKVTQWPGVCCRPFSLPAGMLCIKLTACKL